MEEVAQLAVASQLAPKATQLATQLAVEQAQLVLASQQSPLAQLAAEEAQLVVASQLLQLAVEEAQVVVASQILQLAVEETERHWTSAASCHDQSPRHWTTSPLDDLPPPSTSAYDQSPCPHHSPSAGADQSPSASASPSALASPSQILQLVLPSKLVLTLAEVEQHLLQAAAA